MADLTLERVASNKNIFAQWKPGEELFLIVWIKTICVPSSGPLPPKADTEGQHKWFLWFGMQILRLSLSLSHSSTSSYCSERGNNILLCTVVTVYNVSMSSQALSSQCSWRGAEQWVSNVQKSDTKPYFVCVWPYYEFLVCGDKWQPSMCANTNSEKSGLTTTHKPCADLMVVFYNPGCSGLEVPMSTAPSHVLTICICICARELIRIYI